MRFLIALCVVTGAALVYLMSQASSNSEAFSNNITTLLKLGVGLAAGLAGLILYQLAILRKKLRERVFGSKLTLRLMVVFALMALIPGGLMYAVSYQFIQRSIESWFDVRVDESLNVGLRLAQNTLLNSTKELGDRAESMANVLATSQAVDVATLNRLREQYSIEEATLSARGGASSRRRGRTARAPVGPAAPELSCARCGRSSARVQAENIPERGMYLARPRARERAHDRR
jgi:nitrogen fixation/metabolism regulation signal transduction histidine kinase